MKIATCKGASRVAIRVVTSTKASSPVERIEMRMWSRLKSEKARAMTSAPRQLFGTKSISGTEVFFVTAISTAATNVSNPAMTAEKRVCAPEA